jgi:hypothetical protein
MVLAAFIAALTITAYFVGSGLERTSRANRYARATKGKLATRSFKPGAGKALPYFRAGRGLLMSNGEFAFYTVLRRAVGQDFDIMSKVRAAAVVNCSRGDWAAGYGAPISQKELDFVLLKPGTSFVVAAVELDDKTHELPERRERDAFLDAAFDVAGVPLLRFRARARYECRAVRATVLEELAARGLTG